MARFITIFMLIPLNITLFNLSLFMLSIIEGAIYTEIYALEHILEIAVSSAEGNSQKIDSGAAPRQDVSHHHILSPRYTIPENAASLPEAAFSGMNFYSAYSAFSDSLKTNLSQKQLFRSKKLKHYKEHHDIFTKRYSFQK